MSLNSPFTMHSIRSLAAAQQTTGQARGAAEGQAWRFDPLSFALGLVIALVLLALVYRYREPLGHKWEQTKEKAAQLRRRLTANMSTRYSTNVIEAAQTTHVFAGLAPFDRIHVETLLQVPLASAGDDSEHRTLSPLEAIRACERVLIVGRPGSGRTTLLNYLLVFHANRLRTVGEKERVPFMSICRRWPVS